MEEGHSDGSEFGAAIGLARLTVAPVAPEDEPRSRALVDEHHCLGAPWKIGQTAWHAAEAAGTLECFKGVDDPRDASGCRHRIEREDMRECIIQLPCPAPAD